MKKVLILPLLLLGAVSASESLTLRILSAQKALLANGPSFDLLSDYEQLVLDLRSETLTPAASAQVYYQKALVEISLNKGLAAMSDLSTALELDPTFRPATNKLADLLMSRGQFDEIRARFDESSHPELYLNVKTWEETWQTIHNLVEKLGQISDELFDQFDNVIFKLTPELIQAYELRLQCWKLKLKTTPIEARGDIYNAIIADYSKLVKLLPQRNLSQYPEFAQYLLFTKGNFQDGFQVVKNCLRIDHDYKQCTTLSKFYSRMQSILKPSEEYFIRDGYLYHASEEFADFLKEKLDSFSIDWAAVYELLIGPVKVPKRELKSLPKDVSNNYQYLILQAKEFASAELGDINAWKDLPFVHNLNKLLCESAVMINGDVKNSCKPVDESKEKFFPKHVHTIDSALKRGKLQEARDYLLKFNKNVQKTDMFQKRWEPIRREEERQQQEQHRQQQQWQQQQFHQQQQRQHQQQQQQQQSHMDRSKDYYKILDVKKDADEKSIRKAYRAQTLKFHPDKYKGGDLSESEIETKMQEINEAYEVLSNPQAKADYDNGPHEQHHQGNFHQGQRHGGHPSRQGGMQFNFNQDEFLKNFHGGGFQFHF